MYCWRQSSRPIEKKQTTNKTMHIQNGDNHNSVIHKYRFLGNTSIVTCLDLFWKMCKKCFNLHRITHNTKEKSLYSSA